MRPQMIFDHPHELEYPTYESIVDLYIQGIQKMYGKKPGQIRGAKGALVENIVEAIVYLAWYQIAGDLSRIHITQQKETIRIQEDYVNNLPSEYIKNHIRQNKDKYVYDVELDRIVMIDSKYVLGIECKAYMENAMFKRTLKDFELIARLIYPNLLFCVFQLENSLGGDYGEVGKNEVLGSGSTHTLLSHTPEVKLEIITLLDGNRKSDREIHKQKHFKELPAENVAFCVDRFQRLLAPFQ